MTKDVTVELKVTVHGSVLCSLKPVSPDTPFRVIDTVLDAGGIMVQETTVDPPVGRVIVLAPLTRERISNDAGLAALEAADIMCVATTSPLNVIVFLRAAVTAILYILAKSHQGVRARNPVQARYQRPLGFYQSSAYVL